MYEQLYKSIHEHVSLSDYEWEICKNSFTPRKLRKRQYWLQEGEVCNRLAYIEKGVLYSYSLDEKGGQQVIQFAFEGWWISDLHSFITKDPSGLNIEVLEDCEVLQLSDERFEKLLEEIPGFSTYQRILFQRAVVALHRRLENTLGLTAEEKYSRFLKDYPEFSNRVSQHLIASYLGISPETLSRVRGQLAS